MNQLESFDWQIIVNPNALNKKRLSIQSQWLEELSRNGIHYKLWNADGAGQGMALAEKLCREGCRHLMVMGGDGSVNEVVNGIYRSEIPANEMYLAILPLGTGNDFCRTFAYPKDKSKVVDFLLHNDFHPVDVGVVESVCEGRVVALRRFINIAGFAFDAAVIRETVGAKPKIGASAVYLSKLLKVLFSYRPMSVTVHTEEEGDYTCEMFTIAVGNAQFNGNGMRQVPMADPTDGLLDVVTIRKLSPLKVIANVKNLFSGKHISLPEVKVFTTRSVEISSKHPIPGEVEGEMLVEGNYRISLETLKINILGNI